MIYSVSKNQFDKIQIEIDQIVQIQYLNETWPIGKIIKINENNIEIKLLEFKQIDNMLVNKILKSIGWKLKNSHPYTNIFCD